MNYYYDLTLDFLENNYPFYEVDKTDEFIKVKKIPFFQVDSKVLKDFLLNKVKVEESFLNVIKNKTVKENNETFNAVLLADKNNVVAFNFDNEGNLTGYSSIAISEELNILEIIYSVKRIEISYEKIRKNKKSLLTRKEEKIKNIIIKEITKLYQENNLAKLQYLYLEWCDVLENDINLIYENMVNKINKEIDKKEEKIYQIIELSHNNV